jgi:HSP20 family protein
MKLMRYRNPELATWTPWDRLTSLREEMNRLFENVFPGALQDDGLFGGWSPALDVFEDKDNVVVKAELPGMKKEEIQLQLLDDTLTISGERKHEEEHKDGQTFRSERFFGKFHRSIALPAAVDAGKVSATYKDGVLTVTLPKAEEAKPKQIDVKVD